jgi:ketosteroid isomerase-like protein
MSADRNTQVVKDAYAAFLRGDVASILDNVADDVEWEGVKGAEGVLPQAGVRRGRAAVAQFFQQVNDTVAFETFDPIEYVATGDTVVAIGRYSGKAKPTGRALGSDWAMVFTIRDGKVTRFREFTDSAMLVRAFAAAAAV